MSAITTARQSRTFSFGGPASFVAPRSKSASAVSAARPDARTRRFDTPFGRHRKASGDLYNAPGMTARAVDIKPAVDGMWRALLNRKPRQQTTHRAVGWLDVAAVESAGLQSGDTTVVSECLFRNAPP
jgi:hypothetical protein